MCLIGWQKYLECRHFSPPLKALEASQARPRRKVLLLFPLTPRSSVNGCGLYDWPKLVCIDPAHPTPESAASCRLTPPEESPRQMKTHPAALSLPQFKRLSTYTFIYCLLIHVVLCDVFLFPLHCAHYWLLSDYLIYQCRKTIN